jgi:alpha-glucosidase
VSGQREDPGSFLNLYRAALRLRRSHPALGYGHPGAPGLTWRDTAPGMLCFSREPGFVFAANLGPAPAQLPPHREVLLASGPVTDGKLPPDTGVWLAS